MVPSCGFYTGGPQEVLSAISDAELLRRGGTAFPTAGKWGELLKAFP
ncbi:hypothetical protein TPY_0567 [Sulfobacillus acidophilus TPY]|nr:hypothetical protein TPY_0567 [Sulfobacillus acidophilus TPY]